MATAEAGEAREPPGLGPRTRRSTATRYMDAAGGGEEEKKKKHRDGLALNYVLALRVALPLTVAVSRMDAGVPRKVRTTRPRAEKPSVWWAFRLPVPLLKEVKDQPGDGRGTRPEEEARRSPRPQGLHVCLPGPSPPDLEEKPAKKARRCVQCGSAETPQWRSGPMGRSTLCNACGVRLRAAGALRETEHRPTPASATARRAVDEKSPESPASDSPPDSPIYERRAPVGDVYLVRKQPKRETRTPRKEIALAAPSPAIYLVKKKKPSKKPWRPRNTGQRCLHCGTTSTPQWREGPMGRHTLCNACGVRYRQGRLLPEYRPAGSPTFVPWEHASRHREVLQLHRQRQNSTQHRNDDSLLPDRRVDAPGSDGGDQHNNVFLLRRQRPEKDQQYPPTPLHRPLPQPVDDDDPRVGRKNDGAVEGCSGDDDQTDAPSALDSLLLDGPSAPLIVDGDEFLVS